MTAVTSYPFGRTSDGKAVAAWKIENSRMSVTVIEYGAAVQALTVPDRKGASVDVVLGYRTIEEYEGNICYVGATVGRVCNRIGGADFSLNGKLYSLAKNDGENHLHGGIKGFDKCVWQGAKTAENSVTFSRLSPDGEENYPGNLTVSVTFTLTEDTLKIIYDADTDADTLVNLTNHSYFNLNGGGSVLEHELMISSDSITENDSASIPTGRFIPVVNTPFDFNALKPIGRDIEADDVQLHRGSGYDHNFVLSGALDAAVLQSEQSGIRMTMHTDMPGVQLYSANFLSPRPNKDGRVWGVRDAACLETQMFPNAMNSDSFLSPVLHAGEHMHSETAYSFDLI